MYNGLVFEMIGGLIGPLLWCHNQFYLSYPHPSNPHHFPVVYGSVYKDIRKVNLKAFFFSLTRQL